MASRYVRITTVEEFDRLAPTGCVLWKYYDQDVLECCPAYPQWSDPEDEMYGHRHEAVEEGFFWYLVEDDTSEE